MFVTMNIYSIIFIIAVAVIEFSLFYSPLYLISYSWLKLDKKYGDTKISSILVVLAIVLSFLSFRFISNSIYFIMVSINDIIYR